MSQKTQTTTSTVVSPSSANTPVNATFETYVSKITDSKKVNALKEVHAKAQTKKVGQAKQTVFGITANVSFLIPKILSGAFNAFHKSKGRLTWNGKTGSITTEGAKYFTQREGAVDEKAYKLFIEACNQAKYPLKDVDGIQWPVNPQGIKWIPGQGSIGQSAFFFALCKLTQEASKAK